MASARVQYSPRLDAPNARARRSVAQRVSVRARVSLSDVLAPLINLGRKEGTLNEGIASFYDESSSLWENMWGEHMHHGIYREGEKKSDQQVPRSLTFSIL